MHRKKLEALVENVVKTAIRGRTTDGNALFDMGTMGFSVVHGRSGRLGGRGVLLCAVGLAARPGAEPEKVAEAIPYKAMRTDAVLRERVGEAVRTLVARVEGVCGAESAEVC